MRLVLICLMILPSLGYTADLNISPFLNDEYKNANDVIIEEQIHYTVISQEKATKEVHKKMLILNENSNDRGYAEFYDKFTRVINLQVVIYDTDGKKIEKYKKKDFRDLPTPSNELYSDSRVLSVDLEKFNPPFIIEVNSKVEYDGMQTYDFYVPNEYNQAVVKSNFTITCPSHLNIRYKAFNGASDAIESRQNEEQVLQWEFEDLPAIEPEPLGPGVLQYFPYVKIFPSDFYYDGYSGSQETWERFNSFYYDLNSGRDQLTPEMAEIVHQLTKDVDDERSKIDALYTYLKENMRYISVQLGIGGWQTFDAAYVEKNKYGDCKALSNFMGSMLSEIGIENNKVIIKRGEEHYNPLSEDFVDATLFNHAILYVPSQDLFVECTSNNYPLGYLGNDNANKKVMISTAEGPIFKHTPFMGKNENVKHSQTTIDLSSSGGAQISGLNEYSGYRHDYSRFILPKLTAKEKKERFQKSFPIGIEKLKSYETEIVDNEPKVIFSYDLDVAQYGSKAGKRLFIPLDAINSEISVPQSVDQRSLPFYSIVEETVENELVINIPEEYEIEALPSEDFSEESKYGDFRLSIKKEGNTIKIYKKWISKIFVFPPEQYEDYREKMKTFSSLDKGKIVLVKKKT